jgi:hypothetical protein
MREMQVQQARSVNDTQRTLQYHLTARPALR